VLGETSTRGSNASGRRLLNDARHRFASTLGPPLPVHTEQNDSRAVLSIGCIFTRSLTVGRMNYQLSANSRTHHASSSSLNGLVPPCFERSAALCALDERSPKRRRALGRICALLGIKPSVPIKYVKVCVFLLPPLQLFNITCAYSSRRVGLRCTVLEHVSWSFMTRSSCCSEVVL